MTRTIEQCVRMCTGIASALVSYSVAMLYGPERWFWYAGLPAIVCLALACVYKRK